MMNKTETNAYMRAVEVGLRSISAAFEELNCDGEFGDDAFERFRKVRIDFINLNCEFQDVRGWNGND